MKLPFVFSIQVAGFVSSALVLVVLLFLGVLFTQLPVVSIYINILFKCVI